MGNSPILSICIPSHNRADAIVENLKDVLKINDDRFDVVITDTSNTEDDYKKLLKIRDTRVKIIKNDINCSAMENWFWALENADGVFAIHLNDRDKLIAENLVEFISFLEEHEDFTGGVCKFMPGMECPLEYHGVKSTVMNLPYFSLHMTGLVFHTGCWRKISDRKELFTREKSGCHPHDMILGRLAIMGDMFLYTKQIWKMASPEFYKKNLSGTKMVDFFEPRERLFELKCCLSELEHLDGVESDLKKQKRFQTIKNYLNLSTSGYFYHTESEHEAIHYGNQPVKRNIIQKINIINDVLKMYRNELRISEKEYRCLRNWTYRNFAISELAKSGLMRNNSIRKVLRNINRKRKSRENASLR